MYNHFSALHGAQTELWHCKWARFRFRSAPTQTQTHTQTKFRRQSSSFCSCQSRKALNILFCFHQSFKQLLHRGAPPPGRGAAGGWRGWLERHTSYTPQEASLQVPDCNPGSPLTRCYNSPTVTLITQDPRQTKSVAPPSASSLPQCVYSCCHVLTRQPNITNVFQREKHQRAFSLLFSESVRRASHGDGLNGGSVCLRAS